MNKYIELHPLDNAGERLWASYKNYPLRITGV